MKRSTLALTAVVAVFTLLSHTNALAGNPVKYNDEFAQYEVNISKKAKVIVAAKDARPYITNGDKKPNFVGLERSLFGVPYSIYTFSQNSFADDMGQILLSSLNKEGIDALKVDYPLNTATTTFLSNNSVTGRKSLIFTFNEWKTDMYGRMTFHYDVTLTVYDDKGNKLASSNEKGSKGLKNDGEFGENPAVVLVNASNNVLSNLINSPQIITVFTPTAVLSDEIDVPTEKTVQSKPQSDEKCTVQQVLKMKDAGLSDNQIEAACQ